MVFFLWCSALHNNIGLILIHSFIFVRWFLLVTHIMYEFLVKYSCQSQNFFSFLYFTFCALQITSSNSVSIFKFCIFYHSIFLHFNLFYLSSKAISFKCYNVFLTTHFLFFFLLCFYRLSPNRFIWISNGGRTATLL